MNYSPPGLTTDEARKWCELGEITAHWDRPISEAEAPAREDVVTLSLLMCRPVEAVEASARVSRRVREPPAS